MILVAAKDWLSPPKSLWDTDRHVRGRRRHWGIEGNDADEEHAVHEALRSSTVAMWKEMVQRMFNAEARVEELEADNKKLRSRLSGRKPVTHCPRGHELTPDNVYESAGTRTCKMCAKARQKARYAERKKQ